MRILPEALPNCASSQFSTSTRKHNKCFALQKNLASYYHLSLAQRALHNTRLFFWFGGKRNHFVLCRNLTAANSCVSRMLLGAINPHPPPWWSPSIFVIYDEPFVIAGNPSAKIFCHVIIISISILHFHTTPARTKKCANAQRTLDSRACWTKGNCTKTRGSREHRFL